MTKKQLKEYLVNLNLDYYTESELEKLFKAVVTAIVEIEDHISIKG